MRFRQYAQSLNLEFKLQTADSFYKVPAIHIVLIPLIELKMVDHIFF